MGVDKKISELLTGSNFRANLIPIIENNISKNLTLNSLFQDRSNYVLSLDSDTNHNTTLTRSSGYKTIFCDTTDRDLNLTLYTGQIGDELDIFLTTDGGKVIISGAGGQTIFGLASIPLVMQYNRLKLVCDGSNWMAKGSISVVDGWINRNVWGTKHLGTPNIILNDSSGFEEGELITESVSGNTWRIRSISGNTLISRAVSGTGVATDTRTITGTFSGATDTVNGNTINNNTNFFHGLGNIGNFQTRLLMNTSATKAGAQIIGESDGFISGAQIGVQYIIVDTNNGKYQSGTGGINVIQDDGTFFIVDVESWCHYIELKLEL